MRLEFVKEVYSLRNSIERKWCVFWRVDGEFDVMRVNGGLFVEDFLDGRREFQLGFIQNPNSSLFICGTNRDNSTSAQLIFFKEKKRKSAYFT